ncbi:MAG: DoxX family membrane protein [Flavobacteriales bacterium]|jgi:uncharacterized membrane protein|nr:MAG: DoxX family membrane protein [Flavobacteriales bacterium]|tara:strand:- start:49 stop:516 length:468 start_codon:yes stop_codon:yes gene_type:complete
MVSYLVKFLPIYKNITIYILSVMYIIIGIKHFTSLEYFINIMPPFIPFKEFAVYFTGVIEIFGGLLLLSKSTRKIGAFLIITLLFIVFPANIYLYISEVPRELLDITKNQALIRMPFQIPLIILAYWHSQKNVSTWLDILSSVLFIPTVLYFTSL